MAKNSYMTHPAPISRESDALSDFREKAELQFPGMPSDDVRKLFMEIADFSIDGTEFQIPLTEFAADILARKSLASSDLHENIKGPIRQAMIGNKEKPGVPVHFMVDNQNFMMKVPSGNYASSGGFLSDIEIVCMDAQKTSHETSSLIERVITPLHTIAMHMGFESGVEVFPSQNSFKNHCLSSHKTLTVAERTTPATWVKNPTPEDVMALVGVIDKAISSIRNGDFQDMSHVVSKTIERLNLDIQNAGLSMGDIPVPMLDKLQETIQKKYHETAEMVHEAIEDTSSRENADKSLQKIHEEEMAHRISLILLSSSLLNHIGIEQITDAFPELQETNEAQIQAIVNTLDITHSGLISSSGCDEKTVQGVQELYGEIEKHTPDMQREAVIAGMARYAESLGLDVGTYNPRFTPMELSPGMRDMIDAAASIVEQTPGFKEAEMSNERPYGNDITLPGNTQDEMEAWYRKTKSHVFGYTDEPSEPEKKMERGGLTR